MSKEIWGVSEHETALKALENAGSYDGLDLGNLASVETIMGKAQLIEYMYGQDSPELAKEEKSKGNKKGSRGQQRAGMFDEASVFTGTHRESGDIMLCLELLSGR